MGTKKKMIVAGHVCLDITPAFKQNEKKEISKIFRPGTLITVDNATLYIGGAVGNSGIAMKRMGGDVRLIGKVGQDPFGDIVMGILKEHGVEQDIIVEDSLDTAYTVVLAPPGIDRMFLHNGGLNHYFSYDDIDFELVEKSDLFHFGYPPTMKEMYENNGEGLIKTYKKIKELNTATSLDMAMVDGASPAGKVDWKYVIETVLPYVDFFVPSIEETIYMLDKDKYDALLERADGKDVTTVLSIERDIKPVADRLMELGAKVLLLKCGAAGLYYRTAGKDTLEKVSGNVIPELDDWADRDGFQKSFMPEQVLSGTGAGDVAIGAFLTAMSFGYSFNRCINIAAAQGAACVEAYDSLSGLKDFDVLEKKIADGWVQQDFIKS